MSKRAKRFWLLGIVAVIGIVVWLIGKPAYLLSRAWLMDRPVQDGVPPGIANDASRLNQTPIEEIWPIPAEPTDAQEQLKELLARARTQKLGVSIAGARHSMGGHT